MSAEMCCRVMPGLAGLGYDEHVQPGVAVQTFGRMSAPLRMWVIYERPRDYPEWFVVRRYEVVSGVTQGGACVLCNDLEEARGKVPPGCVRFVREAKDDPVIVESWV